VPVKKTVTPMDEGAAPVKGIVRGKCMKCGLEWGWVGSPCLACGGNVK